MKGRNHADGRKAEGDQEYLQDSEYKNDECTLSLVRR